LQWIITIKKIRRDVLVDRIQEEVLVKAIMSRRRRRRRIAIVV